MNQMKFNVEITKETTSTDDSLIVIRDVISSQVGNHNKDCAIILLKRIINYCTYLLELAD